MTDNVEMRTTNPWLLTMLSSVKSSASECDNVVHPEIARLAPTFPFPVLSGCCSCPDTFTELAVVKKSMVGEWIHTQRLNFESICYNFRDINTSGFGGYDAISGYQALSLSPKVIFSSSL